ncbi:MAG: SPL family radical SAM protein [Bacteriovoracaceae bacterium]
MFDRLFVEVDVFHHSTTQKIIKQTGLIPETISSVEKVWGQKKKPYLDKRVNLNLFIGKKRGTKVKEAPPAYGQKGERHYYFIHAYNCIYECQYCYLQGYFKTPDIVLFVNHDEIIEEMEIIARKNPQEKIWFHAGEFSDSLALSHLTGELEIYHAFLQRNPNAQLELRTKSANIKALKLLTPLPNLFVSFSLAPENAAKTFDLKTPGTKARIRAMAELAQLGFTLGLHFDPIIYQEEMEKDYAELFEELQKEVKLEAIAYISLGVVRFTKEVYAEVEKNYPDSPLHAGTMIKSFDNKVRYPKPMRLMLMNKLKLGLINIGIASEKIYLCMEEELGTNENPVF